MGSQNVTNLTKLWDIEMRVTKDRWERNTNTSVEDMVLFTSHNETVLQRVYNKRSKWPASAWMQSMARAC